MKKFIEIETTFCDCCKKQEFTQPCLRCGIDLCSNCQASKAVEYAHAVHVSGSDDGMYCNNCIDILKTERNPRFEAYQAISRLRAEYKAWTADFRSRAKAAEETLEKLNELPH